ncbi:sigma-70 family RNA polymerase sigma factor [Nonomuraea dietziae]|uniref:RNA polymerase sigma factor n=1 Tax=Nonomuraea dietziae TaxID=65515 RepID=UPI0033C253F4
MYTQPTYAVDTVLAARSGDGAAVDELVRSHLPLVYNIAGRALDGHPDVDDVVQETMARVVGGLPGLRDPESFRSWLVAITMSQVRDWQRARTPADSVLDEVRGLADTGADFVGVTVIQLGLSGQRKETAEATRWLDPDDRQVLSLWWLEVAGRLSRAELAAGLGVSEQHAAVRVQRMKRRLERSRAVVRAVSASPRCGALAEVTIGWDGAPSPLWRKRISKHVRECDTCADQRADLVPVEGLLAGLGLVALPAGLSLSLLVKGKAATAAGLAGTSLATKPIAVAAIGVTVIAGGAAVVHTLQPAQAPRPRAVASSPAPTPARVAPTAAVPSSPPPAASPSPTPTTRTRTRSRYGSVVDVVDHAPPRNRPPAPLPERAAGTLRISGKHGYSRYGGAPQMTHRGDFITVTGRGYIGVRWGILYRNRIGHFPPATWTGLKGKLFHVASGGGRRMDDEQAPGVTWMGAPDTGVVTLPKGHQQMWQNEFYYLDGSVTLHNNEGGTDVDLSVAPRTWREIWADLTAKPDLAKGIVRYGLTRDTGDDRAPVPQYVTRARPADPHRVPQRSQV